jgi:ubiquitin carboxyl-terminal hydrolase 34
MISNAFAVLIEASMHDWRVWDVLKQDSQVEDLISRLLLDEPRQGLRKEVADTVSKLCAYSSQRQGLTAYPARPGDDQGEGATSIVTDIIGALWNALLSLFPRTLLFPSSAQEFFDVALAVFPRVAEQSPSDETLREYLMRWSEILLQHKTQEVGSVIDFPYSPHRAWIGS